MKIEIGPYREDEPSESLERKIEVHIDEYDTWSMDHTLSYIIAPMLKQLKATTHGAPYVDDEDVPEHLRSTAAKPKKDENDTDEFHFDRWDWVLDEMIWAFEQHDNGDSKFFDHTESEKYREQYGDSDEFHFNEMIKLIKVDRDGLDAWHSRKNNAFKLFGKYYQSLWD